MDGGLTFSMAGAPRGKGRPRTTVRGGFARVYTDPKTRTYESSVKGLARKAMGEREPFVGALSVSIRFRLELPKSMTKRDRAAALAGERAYLGRTDLDNLAKAILDGCNGVCWVDDAQIVRLFLTKVGTDKPGVDVKVEPLEPQDAVIAVEPEPVLPKGIERVRAA